MTTLANKGMYIFNSSGTASRNDTILKYTISLVGWALYWTGTPSESKDTTRQKLNSVKVNKYLNNTHECLWAHNSVIANCDTWHFCWGEFHKRLQCKTSVLSSTAVCQTLRKSFIPQTFCHLPTNQPTKPPMVTSPYIFFLQCWGGRI